MLLWTVVVVDVDIGVVVVDDKSNKPN